MKLIKILFIAALLIFSSASVTMAEAGQDSSKYVTGTDTEKLIDKYTSEFSGAIKSLAKELEQPASHVYAVLIKQKKIQGWISVSLFLFGLITTIVLFALYDWFEDRDLEDGCVTIIVITICLAIAGLIWFCADGHTGIFNPEYGAIKDIMRMIN